MIKLSFPLMLLLAVVLGCGNQSNRNGSNLGSTDMPASPTSTNTNAATPAPEKAIVVTSKALSKAYDENELSADDKYKGKPIEVTGKIKDIAETMGNMTVSLEGHDFLQTILCSFEDAERPSLTALKKGQNITLHGVGNGKTLSIYVGLQKCSIKK